MSNMSLQSSTSESAPQDRFNAWQQGQIDYLGADSFDNIQKKLDESIKQ